VKQGLKVTGEAMQQVLSGLNLLCTIWGQMKPKAIVAIAAEVGVIFLQNGQMSCHSILSSDSKF